MKKPGLHKGRIYLKDGVWVVRYETKERVRGGSPKQLGSYKIETKANYMPILLEDTKNLVHPYSQGKETCFEVCPPSDIVFPVAKLWPVSEMAQELQHYFETTPQEQIDRDWEKIEQFDNVGPTVEEFLQVNKSTQMKELFLLRGLPGSGKSTLANSIGGTHVEADTYFLDPQGEYVFDASKLKHAHEWCQDTVEATMKYNSYPEVERLNGGFDRIVVSNTFTQEWEMQPYFDLAEKYGYRVYSLIVENRHGVSEDTNIHNVPKDAIQKMRDRFEISL